MLCITVKNSPSGNYKFKNNELVTSNKDTVLKQVRAIVTAHGGSFTVLPETDCFTARVLVSLES